MAYNRDSRDRHTDRSFGGNRDFGRGSFGGGRRERELFKTVCAKCGEECEVPFKPTGSKPVYCRDCFRSMDEGDSRRSNFGSRDRVASQPNYRDQFDILNAKIDMIVQLLKDQKLESAPTEKAAPVKKKTAKKTVKKDS